MPRYRVSRKAIRDLDSAWYFIAKDNEVAAERLLDRIHSLFRTLASQPNIGRSRPEIAAHMRSIPVEDYIVFYEPTSYGVRILRIWDARQNPAQLTGGL